MYDEPTPDFDELTDLVRKCHQRGWDDRLLRHVVARGDRYAGKALDALLSGDRTAFEFRHIWHARHIAIVLTGITDLPGLPDGAATSSPGASKVIDKIRALLAKAESTTFPDEADALVAKAQELMTRYAIEQATLAGADDRVGTTTVTVRHVPLDDPYMKAKYLLLSAIARANRSRAILNKGYGLSTVFGTADDLEATEMLFTSLLMQATTGMLAHGSGRHSSQTRSFRHAFLIAFATRIGQRLEEANERATDEAGPSALPVLAAAADAAERAVEEAFPRLRTMSVSSTNGEGLVAGRDAGDRASLATVTPIHGRRGLRRSG